jgi:hypothetical protein
MPDGSKKVLTQRITLHPLTLNFSKDQANLEDEFRHDYFNQYLSHFRTCNKKGDRFIFDLK